MISIVTAIVVAIIIFLIILGIKSSPKNPESFARMIARQQVMAFKAVKKANPQIGREELYLKTLTTRVQHREPEIRELIAAEKARLRQEGGELRLRELVSKLVVKEYADRMKLKKQDDSQVSKMLEIVRSSIPEDL